MQQKIPGWVNCLQIGKVNGEWKIINGLWETELPPIVIGPAAEEKQE